MRRPLSLLNYRDGAPLVIEAHRLLAVCVTAEQNVAFMYENGTFELKADEESAELLVDMLAQALLELAEVERTGVYVPEAEE